MTDLGIPGLGDATLIASGGSALVYKAQTRSGQSLAVKVLRGIRGAEHTRRFERELSAAERLNGHPNIMHIHHTGITAAGEPFMVMPLFNRGSLSDELDRTGPFPLRQATGDVATAAAALEFAHSRGVLHRDIKPANLLRADDGSVIVSDFGIARVVDAGISSATIGASTPLYAAPELLAENDASVRSEVYALGALLYALLAGQAAFGGGDNIWATMNRIRTETPPPIDGVPAPVMRVIHQAMAKHPNDRPASAAIFRDNLRMALTANSTWTPPVPTADFTDGVAMAHAMTNDVVLGPSRLGFEPAVPDTVDVAVPGVPVVPAAPPAASMPTVTTLPPSVPGSLVPPPAPAIGRVAPPAGKPKGRSRKDQRKSRSSKDQRRDQRKGQGERESSAAKVIAAIAALLLVAGVSWYATTRLLDSETTADAPIAPPVDNSLPSPDGDNGIDNGDNSGTDDPVTIDDLPVPTGTFDTFVAFTGDHFSALLPEGWSLSERDRQESYGFRSRFVTTGAYLNIDTTPKEQREPGGDVAQSARDIAAGISSASAVRTEEVDGLTMHSFTFRNSDGVDSIDIFFEVDGDGYAVVAGSATDPDLAFATARLVALSVRSNPS